MDSIADNQHSYRPLDRRPIKARSWPVWNRLAGWLAQRGVSANAISLTGMIWGILAGIALALTSLSGDGEPLTRLLFFLAAVAIQLRLLANLLDGMVAISSGQASPVGELYNEVPDRISDTVILIGAGYAVGSQPMLGYLAACAALFTAYVRAMGKAAGAAQEYCGPMAKQQRMFLVTVTALYLGLTPASWQPRWEAWGLLAFGLIVVIFGSILTALRRLVRIAHQLRKVRS